MILVDNSQVIMSALFSQYDVDSLANEDLVRHVVLNCYRSYRTKFAAEFGELVICQDSSASWRREFFPEYKASRKKLREGDPEKWNAFYSIMDTIKAEVEEIFPYKNMRIQGCEADDIIGVLCRTQHATEPILILSGDKDFVQLHIYPEVQQYSPIQKKFITEANPQKFLLEQIIRGDSGDGVPNILSDNDVFITHEKRQKSITKKILQETMDFYIEHGRSEDKYGVNWNRNDTLINLVNTPKQYEDKILNEWNIPNTKNRSKILPFMIDKKLGELIADVGDF